MTWPDDRREYEQAIGVNELDGLIRDPVPVEVWCYGFTEWGVTVEGDEVNVDQRHEPTLTVDQRCPKCQP